MTVALALILAWLLGNAVLLAWLGLEKSADLCREVRLNFRTATKRSPLHLPPELRETSSPH